MEKKMTKEEATEFLELFKKAESEAHFGVWRKTGQPLIISNPGIYDTKREAQIVLGIFMWQRPYEQLIRVHTGLTLERYNQNRKKYGLD